MSKDKKKKRKDTPQQNMSELPSKSRKELIEDARKFSKRYRVGDGAKFRLSDYSTEPSFELGKEDKPLVKQTLQLGVEALAALQDILYAQDKWSLLVVFQAMDAAGKDGAIKHVMSGINPGRFFKKLSADGSI